MDAPHVVLRLPPALLAVLLFAGCAADSGDGGDGLAVTHNATGMNYNLQRGQHVDGVTYFCFSGAGEDFLDPLIMNYDHATGALRGPVKVGDNPLAAAGDNHGNPSMAVEAAGYVHVAYGGHGDRGPMQHARSRQPHDISAWDLIAPVDPEATYPNFLVLADGTLLVFYRAGFHEADWRYSRSTDSGDTWSAPVSLLQGGTERNDGVYYEDTYYDGWYANGWGFYLGHDRQTVHAMFKYHAHTFDENDSEENHLYQLQRKSNVYYARMHADGAWRAADGSPLTLPITLEVAESRCRVYESFPKKGYNQVQKMLLHGISTDELDTPYLHFSSEADDAHLVHWDGSAWVDHPGLPARGRVIVRSSAEFDLYGGGHRYATSDAGQTWTIAASIPEGLPVTGMVLQEGFHPDARMLLFEWSDEAQPLYLWGDAGLIHR